MKKQLAYLLLLMPFVLCYTACKHATTAKEIDTYLRTAGKCMSKGNVDSAKTYIDAAFADPTIARNHKEDGYAWYLKGFIYKELYKKYATNLKYRDSAVNDLLISWTTDSSKENRDSNVAPTLKYLAVTYYNDAATNMDSVNYPKSVRAYGVYWLTMKIINPNADFSKTDIPFYNSLGQIYSAKLFSTNKKAYFDSAVNSYSRVLEVDSDNYSANYGLERVYYNLLAMSINDKGKYSLPRVSSNDSLHKLAALCFPYALKVYKLNPDNNDMNDLEGIYYLLNDSRSFKEYKKQHGITE